MPFQSRVFRLPKDVEHPEEYQDAYAVDPEGGVAAVADGVASAIFSRQWAEILAEAALAETPDPNDGEAFAGWLQARRQRWSESIDVTGLAWFQKAKLPLGAFSTLVWVQVAPFDEDREGAFGGYRLKGYAIGDSCLFHVRRGEVVRMFPTLTPEQFEADPVVLGSVDLNRDQLQQFLALDETCYDDDVLVLCSDAVAQWAARQTEAGTPPDWDRYWQLTHAQWEEEVAALRHERQMRYDDATMVLLRVAADGAMLDEPEKPRAAVEVAPAHDAELASEAEPAGEVPPAPLSATAADASLEEDWRLKFREASRNFSEGMGQASSQFLHSLREWRDRAMRKYRERFGPRDEEK
jgi:hypothetical protein